MSFSLVQYDPEAVKVTRQHFEEHRTTITKLYTTKTLKDVMQTMEAAGFKARCVHFSFQLSQPCSLNEKWDLIY